MRQDAQITGEIPHLNVNGAVEFLFLPNPGNSFAVRNVGLVTPHRQINKKGLSLTTTRNSLIDYER